MEDSASLNECSSPQEYESDDASEGKIVGLPEMVRISRPLLVKIKSAQTTVEITCSRDILEMRSVFFREIIDSADEESEIVLMEDNPQAAAQFLVLVHTLSFAPPLILGSGRPHHEIGWNKQWACLSVKWQMDGYIEAFSHIISKKLHDIVSTSQPPGNLKKHRICSMCHRPLPAAHNTSVTSVAPVWCSYCGAYSQSVAVTPSPVKIEASAQLHIFWDMVEVILTHSVLRASPVENRAALVDVLARHKELWDKERILALLSKEDMFDLCSTL